VTGAARKAACTLERSGSYWDLAWSDSAALKTAALHLNLACGRAVLNGDEAFLRLLEIR